MTATAEVVKHIEKQARTWPDQASAVVIADQQTYDGAVDMLRGIKVLRDEGELHHRPIIQAAHETHKRALEALKRIDDPLSRAERIIKAKVAVWTIEQARLLQEANRKAEEEARRLNEESLELSLADLERDGASAAEIQTVIDEAERAPVIVPAVAPVYENAKGVSVPKRPEAEVTDKTALVKHVAAHLELLNLVEVNQTALNQMARAQRELLSLPGVRYKEVPIVSVRR